MSDFLKFVQAIHVAHAVHSGLEEASDVRRGQWTPEERRKEWEEAEKHLVLAIGIAETMASLAGHTDAQINRAGLVGDEALSDPKGMLPS